MLFEFLLLFLRRKLIHLQLASGGVPQHQVLLEGPPGDSQVAPHLMRGLSLLPSPPPPCIPIPCPLLWGLLQIPSTPPPLCHSHMHKRTHTLSSLAIWEFALWKLSVEQKKEHRKGLGAHSTSIIYSWDQASQWTSPDPCSHFWKVEMAELAWWNLKTAKQGTGI